MTDGTGRWELEQRALCERLGVDYSPSLENLKLGIARNVRSGLYPIKGVRYLPASGTTGWYIFAGEEPSSNDDFYVPLHVAHIGDWRAEVIPYLGLPPGYGFVLAPDHEDVWFDEALLVE